MAQWIRRLPTKQKIPGSSPGMDFLYIFFPAFLALPPTFPLFFSFTDIVLSYDAHCAAVYKLFTYPLSYTRDDGRDTLC